MHLYRLFGLFIGMVMCSQLVRAQTLSGDIATGYPHSVVRKVYEVCTKVRLTPERQKQFANFFLAEDSIVANAITSGVPRAKIAHLLTGLKQDYEKLFSPSEWLVYNMQGVAEADAAFINKKLKIMEEVKPLSKTDKEQIYKGFISRRRAGSAESPEREFLKVLQSVTKDTGYYAALYKNEIRKRTQEYVLAYPNYKKYPKNITRDIMAEITPAIAERQRQWILLEYAMPNNSVVKDQMREAIGEKFNPIMRKAELKRGFNMTKSLFATAFLSREQLRIGQKESDSLFNYIVNISIDSLKSKYIADSSLANWRKFEKKTIVRLIGEQKFIAVLGIENMGQAMQWARNQWVDIKKYQLDSKADSVETIRTIAKYQLHVLVSKTMFADEPEKGETDMRLIKNNRPQILNALELAKSNPNSREALKKSFNW